RFVYQRNAASLNVPDNSLHFKCSGAFTMVVCVPTAIRAGNRQCLHLPPLVRLSSSFHALVLFLLLWPPSESIGVVSLGRLLAELQRWDFHDDCDLQPCENVYPFPLDLCDRLENCFTSASRWAPKYSGEHLNGPLIPSSSSLVANVFRPPLPPLCVRGRQN
ncbi:hypothetical protein L195_g040590, partial [Trifolium pratense]